MIRVERRETVKLGQDLVINAHGGDEPLSTMHDTMTDRVDSAVDPERGECLLQRGRVVSGLRPDTPDDDRRDSLDVGP